MKITDLLTIDSIDLNADVSLKEEAIDHLVTLMMKTGSISDREVYLQGIWKREQLGSTGVGEGIAIPHAQNKAVIKPALAAMVVKNGVDFDAIDGKPAQLFFMIAASENGGQEHLQALALLSGMLMDHDFKNKLINAKDAREFLALINIKENENNDIENIETNYDVLAVTACPTGIAHTYMAAKSLKAKAQELNIKIKVETNGASGIDDLLTDLEIKEAKGIIVACDKQVAMERFIGKPVLITSVADGIKQPEKLLKTIVNGEVAIYQGLDSLQKESWLKRFYLQLAASINQIIPLVTAMGALMIIPILIQQYGLFNITSLFDNIILTNSYFAGNVIATMIVALFAGFLGQAIAAQPGFVVGLAGGVAMTMDSLYLQDSNNPGLLGGIVAGMIGGYLVWILGKILKKLPESIHCIYPTVIYPVFGAIMTVIICYFISPYLGAFNQMITISIASLNSMGSLIFGIIISMMMAVDMGGPINKIAYIFGISQVIEGNYDVMAAVMAGGMVPPLVIALATTFFRYKFTKEQLKLGKKNYLQGLMFISEGTLPFVYENRFLVTSACMLSSGIAGGFSMLYNCGLALAHGGIFVLPLMIHPFRYLVALAAGSLAGAMVYGIFKERGND